MVKKQNVGYRMKIHHKHHNSNKQTSSRSEKENLLHRSLSVCLGRAQETLTTLYPSILPESMEDLQ